MSTSIKTVVMVTGRLLPFLLIHQGEKGEPGMHGVNGNAGIKVGKKLSGFLANFSLVLI